MTQRTKPESFFTPACIQSFASSLIFETNRGVCFSRPSKILEFRSRHRVQQTRMPKDRTPLDVAEHVETDKSLNQVHNSGLGINFVDADLELLTSTHTLGARLNNFP
jgi:hypothetical protein